jgi:hypothetical protein
MLAFIAGKDACHYRMQPSINMSKDPRRDLLRTMSQTHLLHCGPEDLLHIVLFTKKSAIQREHPFLSLHVQQNRKCR